MEIFLSQILSFVFLLVVSSFSYILSKKIRFPYTVFLVFIGILLVPISNIPFFGFIDDFVLTPDILFFVLLPILLFESAYNMNYKQLTSNWRSIGFLAIVGFLLSALLISGALYFIFGWIDFQIPYLVCLLFGALISATDPVAVLSIFKSIGAPRRLTTIFEGESLFNDGTAVALFLVVLSIIMHGGDFSYLTIGEGIWKFLSMLFLGIGFGVFMGVLFSKIVGYIQNNEEVEIILTMGVAHVTFLLSEVITHFFPMFPISGVIATIIASMVIGNYGKYKITPRVEVHMQKFWEFFAFIANSLIFILVGLMFSQLELQVLDFMLPIAIAIVVVSLARVISVIIPISIINTLHLEKKIPTSWIQLLSWGSLRGALAMMMVLLIPGPQDHGYEAILAFQHMVGWEYNFSIKEFLEILTISCILFTLFVKATTTEFFMKKLGVNRLHDIEQFEFQEGKILMNLRVIQKLENIYQKGYLTAGEYEELYQKYITRLKHAQESVQQILKNTNYDIRTLIKKVFSLHALGIEKQSLKELFYYNEIDEQNFKYILRKIDRQIERIEHNKPQFSEKGVKNKDYDIFSWYAEQAFRDRYTDVNQYIRSRVRLVITKKVIKELKFLQQTDFGFEKHIFDDIIAMYEQLHINANKKRKEIFTVSQVTMSAIESKLIDKSLVKQEEKVIHDLYMKEMITPKLFVRLKEDIEKEAFSDVKKFL